MAAADPGRILRAATFWTIRQTGQISETGVSLASPCVNSQAFLALWSEQLCELEIANPWPRIVDGRTAAPESREQPSLQDGSVTAYIQLETWFQ